MGLTPRLLLITGLLIPELLLATSQTGFAETPQTKTLQAGASQANATELVFYTYHDKPPYYFSEPHTPESRGSNTSLSPSLNPSSTALPATSSLPTGIYDAFIRRLNQAQQRWQIRLHYLPRKRIDLLLRSSQLDGAVIGVNPVWFKDQEQTRYLWSSPLFTDTDVIAVRADTRFEYQHPKDLIGKVLALPRGYYFWGVTDQIEAGTVTAIETSSELQNLKLISSGRADATILSDITLHYYEEHLFGKGIFGCLETPHDVYTRSILFPRALHDAFRTLAPLIEREANSPSWQAELKQLVGGDGFYRQRLDLSPP